MESTTPSGLLRKPSEEQMKLVQAVKAGNVELMETLLKIPKVKADYVYPWSRTCLEEACYNPSPRSDEVVKLLLEKVNPSRVNHDREQPIHLAAEKGNHLALEALLRDGRTRVNDTDCKGRTALHYAAIDFNENPETHGICLELLLNCPNVDINIPDGKNWTAIRVAAKYGGREAVVKMLKLRPEGFDLDSHVSQGCTDREFILLWFPDLEQMLPAAKGGTPKRDPQALLLTSLRNGNISFFARLLQLVDQDGTPIVDPNYFYRQPYRTTCVHEACTKRTRLRYLDPLLRANANPNLVNPATGEAPIHVALSHRNFHTVKLLLEQPTLNINVTDKHGDTPLHYVVKFVDDENEAKRYVECLLNKDASVDVKNQEGKTAIMAAAELRKQMLVNAMLTKTDIEKEVSDGVTNVANGNTDLRKRKLFLRLHEENCVEFMEDLQKLTMSAQDMKNLLNGDDGKNTFLQTACSLSNSYKLVQLLLEKGINPNLTIEANRSPPLVIAAEKKNYDVMKTLLNVATDVKVNNTDKKGKTALHVVVKNRNLEMVVMLLNNGANMNIRNNLGKEPITTAAMKDLMDMSLQVDQNVFPDEEKYRIKLCFGLFFGLFIHREDQGPLPTSALAAAEPSAAAATSSEERGLHDNQPRVRDSSSISICSRRSSSSSRSGNVHRCHAEGQAEAVRLCDITETHREDCVLKHPLVKSFILLKWPKLEKYYYANLVCVSLFTLFLNIFIIMHCNENGECSETVSKSFMVLTTIFLAGIIFREFLQLITDFGNYKRNKENILDVALIVCTACSVFVKWDDEDIRLIFSVVTVLLCWSELFVVIGRHPRQSEKMEIIKTVAKNFFYFLIWYSMLLASFGICFHLLLRANNDSFSSIWLALFNVFTMMIGELNTGDIKFKPVPVLSCLVFLVFIFLVSIVLLNLLNGLAISDIQEIKESASLLSIRSHVRLIKDIENSLINIYKRKIPLVSRMFALQLKNIMIFHEGDDETFIYIYPNTNSYELSGQIHTVDQSVLSETMKIIGDKSVTMYDSSKSGTQITAKSAIQKMQEFLQEIQMDPKSAIQLLQEMQMDATRNTTSDT